MTNEQLLIISTLVGAVLTFLNARSTASASAIGALSQTIETLRGELEAEQKERKEDRDEFERLLAKEETKREEMGKRFERERLKYQAYIKQLITAMENARIPIPDWDVENDV